MGYATIISDDGAGRYTIETDFGEAQRVALIAACTNALVFVDEKIVALQIKVDAADAAETAQLAVVNAEAANLAAQGNNLPPGSPAPDATIYRAELAKLRKLEQQNEPLRINMRTLKRNKEELLRKRSDLQTLVVVSQRQAWCCDLTENAAGQVATVDIPGESELILIAPGARAWGPNDGAFKARELMSPEQAYYNASILPGWQKWTPTYRWGTITAKFDDLNLVNLTLGPASSSAFPPRLDVNQSPQLNGVTVDYMFCNSIAFEVGDNVVVQFTGRMWELPVVIGFLDTPKRCNVWNFEGAQGAGSPVYYFSTINQQIAEILFYATGVTAECRFDSGAWLSVTSIRELSYTNYTRDPDGEVFYDDFLFRAILGNDPQINGLFAENVKGYFAINYVGPEGTFLVSDPPYRVCEFRFIYQNQVILNVSVSESRFADVPNGVRCLGTYNAGGWSLQPYEIINTPLYVEE